MNEHTCSKFERDTHVLPRDATSCVCKISGGRVWNQCTVAPPQKGCAQVWLKSPSQASITFWMVLCQNNMFNNVFTGFGSNDLKVGLRTVWPDWCWHPQAL